MEFNININPNFPPPWQYSEGEAGSAGLNSYYVDDRAVSCFEWAQVAIWASSNGYEDLPIFPPGYSCGYLKPATLVSYIDVLKWCNAKSEKEGKTPVYWIQQGVEPLRNGQSLPIEWNILDDYAFGRDGYRLPSDNEWLHVANLEEGFSRDVWLAEYPGDVSDFENEVVYFDNSIGNYSLCDTFESIYVGGTYFIDNKLRRGPLNVDGMSSSFMGFYGLCGNVSEYVYTPRSGNCLPSSYARAFGGNFLNSKFELVLSNDVSSFKSKACLLSPNFTDYATCGYPNTFKLNEGRAYVGFRTFRTNINISYTPFNPVIAAEPLNLRSTITPVKIQKPKPGSPFSIYGFGIESVRLQNSFSNKFTSFDCSDEHGIGGKIQSLDLSAAISVTGYLTVPQMVFSSTFSFDSNAPLQNKASSLDEKYLKSVNSFELGSSFVYSTGDSTSDLKISGAFVGDSSLQKGYFESGNYQSLQGIEDLSSSKWVHYALLSNGKVTGWGDNINGAVTPETGLNDQNGIFAGNWSSCWANSLTGVKKVACGDYHTLFLFNNGTVSGIGENSASDYFDQISNLTNVKDIYSRKNAAVVFYENSFQDIISTGFSFSSEDNWALDWVGSLKNVSSFDFCSTHAVASFTDWRVTGTSSAADDCGQIEFTGKVDYPVYQVWAMDYATFLMTDAGSATPLTGNFSLSFSDSSDPLTLNSASNPVLKFLSVQGSLPRKFISGYSYENISGWRYDVQNYDITIPSGSPFDISNYYFSVSGASMGDSKYYSSGGRFEYLKNPVLKLYQIDDSGNVTSAFYGNEFWSDLSTSDKNILINSGFVDQNSFSNLDPALILSHAHGNKNKYRFSIIEGNNPIFGPWDRLYMNEDYPSRYKFNMLVNDPARSSFQRMTNEQDEAFIEYNVSAGTLSRNIFAYNIEFVESTYSNPEIIGDDISSLLYTPVIDHLPESNQGFFNYKDQITAFCLKALECPSNESLSEPAIVCWSGRDITGADYQAFFENFLKSLNSGLTTPSASSQESNLFLETDTYDVFFNKWTGYISFNDFIKGDVVFFDPYNFSGTGFVEQYYSVYESFPPYPNLEPFSLKFKEDFNSPEELVQRLNENFSGYKYNKLWYQYYCPVGLGKQGIFIDIDDAIATAKIVEPKEVFGEYPPDLLVLSGEQYDSGISQWENYLTRFNGRTIKIESNHFHFGGHNLELLLGNVRSPIEAKIQRGQSYLLPTYFELLGSADGQTWQTIDILNNVEWSGIESFAGAEPAKEPLKEYKEFNLDEWLEDQLEVKNTLPGTLETILEFTKRKKKKAPPWCGGDRIEEENGKLVWYAGVPDTFPKSIDLCEQKQGAGEDEEEGGEDDGPNTSEDKAPAYYKKIGRLFDPAYLDLPDHYYLKYIDFNFYKLKIKNFKNEATGSYFTALDEFKIKNITFYSAESFQDLELTGADECVIGADYSVDVSGYVPVLVTGYLSGSIGPDNSGFVDLNNVWVEGEPSGLSSGDWVRFIKQSGRLLSDTASGTIKTGFFVTGEFSTGQAGWYYNPSSKEVTLFKEFNTVLDEQSSGSGFFTSQYIQLKEEVVNRELAAGGFMQPGFQAYMTTGAYFLSDVTGFKTSDKLTGCFEKEFLITGQSSSGYFSYFETVTGSAAGQPLVYGSPTGFVQASGFIDYISPNLGDYIVINDEKLSFNPDGLNFSQPYYFDSFEKLSDTLTGQEFSFLFDCSFVVDAPSSRIYVYSDLPGESGNNISFYYGLTGGITTYPSGSLSGGQDLNQYITALNSATYSGNINLPSVPITGFYELSSSGSGYIYGYVDKLLGVRNFTDIWSLYTGADPKFSNMSLVSGDDGDVYVSGNYTGELLGLYPELLNLNLFYENIFDSASSGSLDMARLGIFDSNHTGSGVYHIIKSSF